MGDRELLNRGRAESIWNDLMHAWVRVEDRIDGKMTIWRKACSLFEAYVEQVEPGRWAFSLVSCDGAHLYEEALHSGYHNDAFIEANRLIFKFLSAGLEMLGGFKLSLDRPHDEVRFKHICVGKDGLLYGLDKDGVVFRQGDYGNSKSVWMAVDMKRADLTAE